MKFSHLIRRTVTSINNQPLTHSDMAVVEHLLLPDELSLWVRLQPRDQRHSLVVLERFDKILPLALATERRAALLHDLGKCESSLGVLGRIVATIVGPRTGIFRQYLAHEEIGIQLLSSISDPRTLQVLRMDDDDAVGVALRRADEV